MFRGDGSRGENDGTRAVVVASRGRAQVLVVAEGTCFRAGLTRTSTEGLGVTVKATSDGRVVVRAGTNRSTFAKISLRCSGARPAPTLRTEKTAP